MRQPGGSVGVGFGWKSASAAMAIALLLLLILWGYRWYFPQRIGPEQPVAFSHRVHVDVKKISCVLCHDQVMHTANAGIPAMETCMLCHARVIITHPQIQKVREHYFRGEPILWEKVYETPDFVYFNHALHLNRSIDCSRCHGNVSLMDRIELAQPLTMGFCISCHREYKATVDCFTCHR
ncbi:MAG: cytochrome c3 family protein [Desulfuromonadales bacterium]